MTTGQEAPELIQYSCERCNKRFQLPPSAQKLGVKGTLVAALSGIRGKGFGAARRELLARMDDEAYQAFTLSFRFCHECQKFVCNDCWSKALGSCQTCAGKALVVSPLKPTVRAVPVPDIPRPVVSAAPPRKGHTRHSLGLVAVTLAIVLLSAEGYLLLAATNGPSDVVLGASGNPTSPGGWTPQLGSHTTTPGDTPGGTTNSTSSAGNTNNTGPTSTDTATPTLGQTPGPPGATPRPNRTLAPGEKPTPVPAPTAPPTTPPTGAPTTPPTTPPTTSPTGAPTTPPTTPPTEPPTTPPTATPAPTPTPTDTPTPTPTDTPTPTPTPTPTTQPTPQISCDNLNPTTSDTVTCTWNNPYSYSSAVWVSSPAGWSNGGIFPASGNYDVTLTVDGLPSNTVTIVVQ
jgi:hypothetical protein